MCLIVFLNLSRINPPFFSPFPFAQDSRFPENLDFLPFFIPFLSPLGFSPSFPPTLISQVQEYPSLCKKTHFKFMAETIPAPIITFQGWVLRFWSGFFSRTKAEPHNNHLKAPKSGAGALMSPRGTCQATGDGTQPQLHSRGNSSSGVLVGSQLHQTLKFPKFNTILPCPTQNIKSQDSFVAAIPSG